VLKSPIFIPITFDGDPLRDEIEHFVDTLPTTPYWQSIVREYGVGDSRPAPAVHIAEAAAPTVTEDEVRTWLQAWLQTSLSGRGSPWPAPAAGTHYALFYPPGTEIDGDVGCHPNGGYHDELWVPGYGAVSFSVLPRCDETAPDVLLRAAHELVESVTDPFPRTSPAYSAVDDAHAVWSLAFEATEIADMCEDRGAIWTWNERSPFRASGRTRQRTPATTPASHRAHPISAATRCSQTTCASSLALANRSPRRASSFRSER
jgi:hypothetical protein